MLWIALYLPELPLQIAERSLVAAADKPTSLIISSGPEHRPVVYMANRAAQGQGIQLGMTIASSRALANDLLIMPRQPDSETVAIHNFAGWACQFTPSVSTQAHEGILMEVSTTLMMHDGLSALLGKLRSGTHALGYHVSCGVAPTPLAAWLFAQARHHGYPVRACLSVADIEARLADLPLALLDWPHDVLSKLSGLGIVRFADCLNLPAEGFSKRFGVACWADLQRALGRLPDPRAYFVAPETYRARTEFGFEVNDAMALLFPLKRLLSEMEGFLRGRGAGVQGYNLVLTLSNQVLVTLSVGVAKPERHTERLLSLARERLSQTQLQATVLSMAIEVTQLLPFVESNRSWLPDPEGQSDSWAQLIDKLTARLGAERVYRLQAIDDHRPEQSWQSASAMEAHTSGKSGRRKKTDKQTGKTTAVSTMSHGGRDGPNHDGLTRPRPLFLLPVPRKLMLDGNVPLCHGRVDIIAGPERIETGWWDGNPARRDYYVGRNPHNETMWLYQDLCDLNSWHLHGYFA
jgi:protein ImuB